MKYLIILILIGFTATMSANVAYGLWVPQSPEKLFEQSETVFVGNVTSVKVLEFERSNTFHIQENGVTRIEVENYTQTLDEYTVTVEEFLKNPQTTNTITMLEATVGGVPGRSVSIGGFELGDRVLFYVPKLDGTNQYSPESFEIPKQCDAKSVLEQPRIPLFNDFKIIQDGMEKTDNFVANKPIKFVYNKDMGTLEGKNFDVGMKISKITDNDWETEFDELIHTESKLCEWTSTASLEFVPSSGRYYMWMNATEGNRTGVETMSRGFTVKAFDFPLKQIKSGILSDEIQCNDGLVLLQKYDGSPACVTAEAREKLIERGWTKYKDGIAVQLSFCGADGFDSDGNPNKGNSTHIWDGNYCKWQPIGDFESKPNIFLDVASIEENRIALNPTDTCAHISLRLLSADKLEQYHSRDKEVRFFEITETDLEELPVLDELIRATHHLDFTTNDDARAEMGLRELVDYEFFIMEKAIDKYDDSQDDYFIKLDGNLDEKLADPKPQGFSNEFLSPQLVYDDNAYVLSHTFFWVANEHETQHMSVHLQDSLDNNEKFITLTEKDMESIPKIKQAIEKIGTEFESIHARKGLPENPDWNEYREWFGQKKAEQFNLDETYVPGFVYDNEYYDLGFPIC